MCVREKDRIKMSELRICLIAFEKQITIPCKRSQRNREERNVANKKFKHTSRWQNMLRQSNYNAMMILKCSMCACVRKTLKPTTIIKFPVVATAVREEKRKKLLKIFNKFILIIWKFKDVDTVQTTQKMWTNLRIQRLLMGSKRCGTKKEMFSVTYEKSFIC